MSHLVFITDVLCVSLRVFLRLMVRLEKEAKSICFIKEQSCGKSCGFMSPGLASHLCHLCPG